MVIIREDDNALVTGTTSAAQHPEQRDDAAVLHPVEDPLPVSARGEHACAHELLEVERDIGLGFPCEGNYLAHTPLACADVVDNPQPGAVSESLENPQRRDHGLA